VILPLLTRTTVTGTENIPSDGPFIAVGNHVAAVEVALMVLAIERQVEFLGTGDLPPPPVLDALTRLYGYIPVFRGRMDRAALEQALDVLRQGGVLGIFPEGGIWRTGYKRAQKGVAWLSYRSRAPMVPMGFGGMRGAMAAMLRLRRPRLSVNIGQPLPPVELDPARPRAAGFDAAAQQVMAGVSELLPPADRPRASDAAEEEFALDVAVASADKYPADIPGHLRIRHGSELSKLLHHPAVVAIFRDRLHLPVRPFQNLGEMRSAADMVRAADSVIGYLERDNPYFLTYRFGAREGGAMQAGLRELRDLARWAAGLDHLLTVTAIHRYRRHGSTGWIEERRVGQPHAW
jgi:1-acyl-sn-glycerol-3-phosphate acyltransferase